MSKQLTFAEAMQLLVQGKPIRDVNWDGVRTQIIDGVLMDFMFGSWVKFDGRLASNGVYEEYIEPKPKIRWHRVTAHRISTSRPCIASCLYRDEADYLKSVGFKALDYHSIELDFMFEEACHD